MIAYMDWIRGDPAAIAAGTALLTEANAFHAGSTDIRQAVATMQKRWKEPPTGTLTRTQLERLQKPKPQRRRRTK